MKFGKQLRLKAIASFAAFYVDYDHLKFLIEKRPADDCESDDSVGGPPSHARAERRAAHAAAPSTAEAALVALGTFSAAVTDEVRKAGGFFSEHLSVARARVDAATAAVAAALARGVGGDAPATASGSVNAGGTLDADVAGAHAAVLSASDLIDDLRSFALLNVAAIEKAAKKFDKRWGAAAGGAAAGVAALDAGALALGVTQLATLAECCAALTQSLPPANAPTPRRDETAPATAGGNDGAPASDVDAPLVKSFDIYALPVNAVSYLRLRLAKGPLDEPIAIPIMIARGAHAGPVLGITSTLHGNELAGVPVIHRIFAELDTSKLCGTIIGAPVLNPPGFLRYTRGYADGADLNRIMPGKKGGSASQSFAFALVTRLIKHFDFLLDLHTASFGRVNSLYVRADMNEPRAHRLAVLQSPQIVVHNTGPDGSLRGACASMGKPAITIEIGNPQVIDPALTDKAVVGIRNTLAHLKMLPFALALDETTPVVCSRSFWMFSKSGGVLTVRPPVAAWVKRGEVIAVVHNIWGALIDSVVSPVDGVIVGKSTNPVCQTGDRVVHLGVVEDSYAVGKVDDGH